MFPEWNHCLIFISTPLNVNLSILDFRTQEKGNFLVIAKDLDMLT
jgi:hypothetical protein